MNTHTRQPDRIDTLIDIAIALVLAVKDLIWYPLTWLLKLTACAAVILGPFILAGLIFQYLGI